MARPVLTNPSGTTGALVTSLSWSHTAEAGKTVRIHITALTNSGSSGETDYPIVVTVGGVAATRHVSWFSAGVGGIMRVWVFTYRAVASGAVTIAMDTTPWPTAYDYEGIAVNDDGQANGACILPGGWYEFIASASVTKVAYGWAADGLQIALAWGGLGAAGLSITGGTAVTNVNGLVLNSFDVNDAEQSITGVRGVAGKLGLFSYCIAPASQAVSGTAYFPLFGGQTILGTFAPGGTVLQIGGPYGHTASPATSNGRQANIEPIAGIIRSMAVRASQVLNTSIRCELIRNAVGDDTDEPGWMYASLTGIFVTLDAANQQVTLDGMTFQHNKYERFGMQFTNTGAGTPASDIDLTVTYLDERGTTEQTYGGGLKTFDAGAVDTAFHRAILHPSDTPWDTFPTSEKSLIGIAATVGEVLADYQRVTALSNDREYCMGLDGVVQDGSGGTVDTKATLVANSLGPALARKRFSLPVVAADFLNVTGFCRNALSQFLRQAVTIVVTPATPGQLMLSGHSRNTSTFDVAALANSSRSNFTFTLANASRFFNIVPPMTITTDSFHVLGGIAVLEPTGPDPTRSTAWQLRLNNAVTAMADITFSGADVGPLTTAGDVAYVGADQLSIRWNATNSPTMDRQFWSIPGFINLVPTPGPRNGTADTVSPGADSGGAGDICPNTIDPGPDWEG